jgi:hypothetical protein
MCLGFVDIIKGNREVSIRNPKKKRKAGYGVEMPLHI